MHIPKNFITKEQVMAAIRELAGKLERRPTLPEICKVLDTNHRCIKRLFGTYTRAVKSSGLPPMSHGVVAMEDLFHDWVSVTKKLAKIPSLEEYEAESKYSQKPLKSRFQRWVNVPEGLLKFGDRKQLWAGWEDVRRVVKEHVEALKMAAAYRDACWPSSTPGVVEVEIRKHLDLKIAYGEPLTDCPLALGPNQEMGVLLLFGWLARQLGFVILKTQNVFPDCEALRRIENGKWLRVWIEFELQSKNFPAHGHDPKGCDLIVCWEHDWQECPVEVIELRKVVRKIAGIAT